MALVCAWLFAGAWPATLQAATWTWNKNTGDVWNNSANWLEGSVPTNVPSGTVNIVFPATLSASGIIQTTEDINNLAINSIAFNYTNWSIYVQAGGTSNIITMAPGATITLNGTAAKRPRLLNGSGTVDLSGGTTTVTNSSSSQRFEFNGADVRNGTLALLDGNYVTQNAGSGTTAANLTLGSSSATTTWNQQGSGGPINYTGLISGPGVFQNNSSVTAVLTNNANSFGQATIFANGGGFTVATLANKGQPCGLGLGTANFNVISANVIGTLFYTGNSVTIDRTFQKNPGATGIIQVDTAGQTLTTSGQLNSGTSGTGTSGYNGWTIQGNGNFTLSGPGAVITDGTNTTTSGHTRLVKNGNGTFTIAAGAAAAHQGGTTVNGGIMRVDGSLPGSVTVSNGATLRGTGTVGNLTAGGTIAAGNGGSTDVFTTGSVAFGNGAGLAVSLSGTNSASIAAGGAVTLGSASSDAISLTVVLTDAPVDGKAYVILTAPSVTTNGLFNYQGTALAEGAQFVVKNQFYAELFSISYGATSITLTALNSVMEPQTITFGSLPWKVVGDADFDPGATASSGLPVSYSSSDTNVATIVNGKIQLVGAGTTTITASQPGNGAYYPATSVNQSLLVYQARQTITFPGMYQKSVGDADFSLAATASSGLPVTYTSLNTSVATIVVGKVHIIGPGIAKIQADQAGNSLYPVATPVIKHFVVDNDGSVLWNRTPENQLFQYSYSEPYTWPTTPDKAANATITPQSYLWIPENCARLKGLIIMQNNVPEHMLVGHPVLRKVAAENGLGIVFFTRQSVYNFNTGLSMDATDSNGMRAALLSSLQNILNGLATVSGYPEVATVPWLPMGESGALLMVQGLVDGAPGRCIAGACMQNPQGLLTTASRSGSTAVPMLMWKGTAYEWGQTSAGNNIQTAWNTDTQYASVVSQRSSWPNWPLTMLLEAGTGHFFMSEQMVAYASQYIGKICALRLPASGAYDPVTNRLNTVDLTTGYLADPPSPGYSDTTVYAYTNSPSITKSWFPDMASAQAGQAISVADWNAATQLPNIAATGVNCTISKYTFNGISDLTANTDFGVTPILEPVVPAQFTNSPGATLAQSPAGAYTKWICGPLIPNGGDTFRLCNDRSYQAAAYIMTIADRTNSPSSIRLSVQPIHLNLSTISGRTAQTITFNAIGDVSAGTSSISLNATASSGLPVNFSVISGPAVIQDNNLIFTRIPPCSKFPVQVTVRAWQWGSAGYNTATPVDRTFNLVKGTQTITFPSIAGRSCGNPDFDPGATASSVLPITYSSDNPGVATINPDGTVHITGAGTANITASQPGDGNFSAALPVVQQLLVQDTTTPVITVAGNNPATNECHATYTDAGATALDACAGTVSVRTSGTVDADNPGIYTLTYTADDGNGNTNTATRTVCVVDTTPPVVTWSFTNLTLNAGAGSSVLMPDVTGTNYIVAADACSPVLTITQTPTNTAVLPLGTNVVVLAVGDGNGNTAYSTNTLVVEKMTAPVVAVSFSDGYLRFTFLRARGDLTYIVEGAFDLSGSWETIEVNPGMVGSEVTVSVPVSSAPRQFLRLKVTQP